MKTKLSYSRYLSLISVAGVLTGGALVAQTSGTPATSGTTGTIDPTRSGISTTQPRNSASSEVTGSTRADTRTGDMNRSNQANDAGSTSSSSRALDNENVSSPAATSGVSGASTNAGSLGGLHSNSTQMGAALSDATDPLHSSLQSGDHASRSQLINDVEQRIDSQRDSVKALKSQGKQLQGQAKSDFKAALDEVENREKDLKRSVREVRNASQENWDSARSQLASNYQAYMAALSRAQLQVGTGVSFPGNSSSTTSGSVRSHGDNTTGTTATETTPGPATSP